MKLGNFIHLTLVSQEFNSPEDPNFWVIIVLSSWYTSDPNWMAWVMEVAPLGAIMNSWKAMVFPECFPPFNTLKNGVGKMYGPETFACWRRNSYNGMPWKLYSIHVNTWKYLLMNTVHVVHTFSPAPALALAILTARMAFAPTFFLLGVPSRRIINSSIDLRSVATLNPSRIKAGAITFSTLCTASWTLFPP